MKCSLCEKEIAGYDTLFNHLVIDEKHAVDICTECIGKIVDWRGRVLATLFPTKALKKRYEKNNS